MQSRHVVSSALWLAMATTDVDLAKICGLNLKRFVIQMPATDRDTIREPKRKRWHLKRSRKISGIKSVSETESTDAVSSNRTSVARGLVRDAVTSQAKAFMFVTGIAALAVGVVLITLAMPSHLKSLYVMGSLSTSVAVCNLAACCYVTVRDRLASRPARDLRFTDVHGLTFTDETEKS